MAEKEFKTNQTHFLYFKNCCKKWLAYFGLHDYDVFFFNQYWQEKNFSTARINDASRTISINLEKLWGPNPITKRQLNRTACHEVIEILLARLANMASDAWDDTNVQRETHIVINRVMNAILPKD